MPWRPQPFRFTLYQLINGGGGGEGGLLCFVSIHAHVCFVIVGRCLLASFLNKYSAEWHNLQEFNIPYFNT